MFARVRAKLAAGRPVAGTPFDYRLGRYRLGRLAGLVAAAITLGGCWPTTAPLVSADPADPGATVAGIRYRSTVAPYTSLRPATPSSRRQQPDLAAASTSGK